MHMTLQQALPHLSARPDVLVSTDMAADERTSDIPSLWKHTTGGERALKEAGEPQVAARLPQRMKAEATLRYQHEEMVNAIRDLLECVGPLEGHNSTSDLWNMAGRIALQQRLKEHAPTVEAYVRIVEEVTRLATTLLCKRRFECVPRLYSDVLCSQVIGPCLDIIINTRCAFNKHLFNSLPSFSTCFKVKQIITLSELLAFLGAYLPLQLQVGLVGH